MSRRQLEDDSPHQKPFTVTISPPSLNELSNLRRPSVLSLPDLEEESDEPSGNTRSLSASSPSQYHGPHHTRARSNAFTSPFSSPSTSPSFPSATSPMPPSPEGKIPPYSHPLFPAGIKPLCDVVVMGLFKQASQPGGAMPKLLHDVTRYFQLAIESLIMSSNLTLDTQTNQTLPPADNSPAPSRHPKLRNTSEDPNTSSSEEAEEKREEKTSAIDILKTLSGIKRPNDLETVATFALKQALFAENLLKRVLESAYRKSDQPNNEAYINVFFTLTFLNKITSFKQELTALTLHLTLYLEQNKKTKYLPLAKMICLPQTRFIEQILSLTEKIFSKFFEQITHMEEHINRFLIPKTLAEIPKIIDHETLLHYCDFLTNLTTILQEIDRHLAFLKSDAFTKILTKYKALNEKTDIPLNLEETISEGNDNLSKNRQRITQKDEKYLSRLEKIVRANNVSAYARRLVGQVLVLPLFSLFPESSYRAVNFSEIEDYLPSLIHTLSTATKDNYNQTHEAEIRAEVNKGVSGILRNFKLYFRYQFNPQASIQKVSELCVKYITAISKLYPNSLYLILSQVARSLHLSKEKEEELVNLMSQEKILSRIEWLCHQLGGTDLHHDSEQRNHPSPASSTSEEGDSPQPPTLLSLGLLPAAATVHTRPRNSPPKYRGKRPGALTFPENPNNNLLPPLPPSSHSSESLSCTDRSSTERSSISSSSTAISPHRNETTRTTKCRIAKISGMGSLSHQKHGYRYPKKPDNFYNPLYSSDGSTSVSVTPRTPSTASSTPSVNSSPSKDEPSSARLFKPEPKNPPLLTINTNADPSATRPLAITPNLSAISERSEGQTTPPEGAPYLHNL